MTWDGLASSGWIIVDLILLLLAVAELVSLRASMRRDKKERHESESNG